jgi:hypothetical protein
MKSRTNKFIFRRNFTRIWLERPLLYMVVVGNEEERAVFRPLFPSHSCEQAGNYY